MRRGDAFATNGVRIADLVEAEGKELMSFLQLG